MCQPKEHYETMLEQKVIHVNVLIGRKLISTTIMKACPTNYNNSRQDDDTVATIAPSPTCSKQSTYGDFHSCYMSASNKVLAPRHHLN